MGLDHEPVQPQVESPLGEFSDVGPCAAHVARVGEEGELRIPGAQFDRKAPAGIVAILDLLAGGEAAVDLSDFLYACGIEPLERSYPEVDVRVYGVLHENRNVRIPQSFSDFLHEERICGGPRPDPEHVNPVLDAFEYVLLARNLRAHFHAGFLLHALQPLEPRSPHAFEAPGVRPGLPDAGPEYSYSLLGKGFCGHHYLHFGLCAAGSGYYHRPGGRENSPFGNGDDV